MKELKIMNPQKNRKEEKWERTDEEKFKVQEEITTQINKQSH